LPGINIVGVLIGMVTVDDILDVEEEELTEDFINLIHIIKAGNKSLPDFPAVSGTGFPASHGISLGYKK
jgi:hypothetical protein